jgi:hypothetical protein
MAITWTSTATQTSAQFGNSYCPQFQAIVSSTPISADKCRINWTINYITHGYVFYCSSIPVNLDISGNVVFDSRIDINQRSGYTVASGSFEMSRTASEQKIYPNMWINWAAVSPTWGGTTKSSNESCASDYFVIFAKLTAPTTITATYNGASNIAVSWSGAANCSKYQLQCRMTDNNGAWTGWTTLSSSITTTSYTYSGTSADKLYQYRVAASDDTVWSSYKQSSSVATKPAAPSSISLEYAGGNNVLITLVNTSKIATGLEVQYSADKSTWTAATTKSGLVTSLTYTETTPGTYYFRARNTRGSYSSAWIVSANAIAVKTKPNKPVWNSNSIYVDYTQGDAILKFKYTSDDKAPIRRLNITCVYDTTFIAYQDFTSDEYIEWLEFPIDFSEIWDCSYGKSATVEITATNETGTSETSDVLTVFFVEADPIYLETTATARVFNNYPVGLNFWTDGDDLKTNIYIYKKGATDKGNSVATIDNKKQYTLTFPNSKAFNFENGIYIAYAEASNKTTGLISNTQIEFRCTWLQPRTLIPILTYDEETGCLTITAEKDTTALQRAEPDEWILYLIKDGVRTELMRTSDLSASYVDWKAFVDGSSSYEIVSKALNGLTSSSEIKTFKHSRRSTAYFYYYPIGSETIKVASTRYNQSEDIDLTQPNRKQVYYAGRTFPLSYNNTNRGDSRSISAYLTSQEEIDSWIELWKQGGRCIFKNDSELFECDVDISFSPVHKGIPAGELKITVTRLNDEVE